jgi:polyhydroxybutyrate depolymerase
MARQDGLQAGQIEISGVRRSYLISGAPEPEAPLLLVLHGTGSQGRHMAAVTALATRGPAAGFVTVFPDGLGRVWDGGRAIPGREGVDDSEFLVKLTERLVADGLTRAGVVFVAGMSNGAFFAEHLARHSVLRVKGLVLVAGTATEDSRQAMPHPAQRSAVLCFVGTADPVVPYDGGPIGATGPFGRVLTRLAARRGEEGASRLAVAAETFAADWASVNGGGAAEPSVEPVVRPPDELPVTRLSWSAPDCPPVVLYRVEGGGHAWPGGPQYLPPGLIGPVAHHLDATGIALDFALRQLTLPPQRTDPSHPISDPLMLDT